MATDQLQLFSCLRHRTSKTTSKGVTCFIASKVCFPNVNRLGDVILLQVQ